MTAFKDDQIANTTVVGADRADARVVDDRAFFTVADIADRWQSSKKKPRRLIASGELAAYRFGGLLRVSPPDLFAYERRSRVADLHNVRRDGKPDVASP